jgi:hypothetical protein
MTTTRLPMRPAIAIYPAMNARICLTEPRRRLRGTFDFAGIADRARMPWRFLARHVTVDALAA